MEHIFDDIGNRLKAASGGNENGWDLRTNIYSANTLNQYTSILTPGYESIFGVAMATNAVTVNSGATSRKGEYYNREISIANGSGPVWQSVTVSSGSSNLTGNILFPPYTQSPTHDADGNLTADGLWTYAWDAENRLLSVTSQSTVPSAARLKMECAYDHMGRRIRKIVSTWNGSAYIPQSTNKFVYDGWNLMAVLNEANGLVYSFTWGSDLSGSMQGAGGVGGLLSMTVHSGANAGTYFYCYDGNGNVVALVNANDGTIAGQWEYDAFGNVLRATGTMAKTNPFLFSTKFYDGETGLYYYGYRYYDPIPGRFLNRDPIEEDGGFNLSGFVDNNPVTRFDLLGELTITLAVGVDSSAKLNWSTKRKITRSRIFLQEALLECRKKEKCECPNLADGPIGVSVTYDEADNKPAPEDKIYDLLDDTELANENLRKIPAGGASVRILVTKCKIAKLGEPTGQGWTTRAGVVLRRNAYTSTVAHELGHVAGYYRPDSDYDPHHAPDREWRNLMLWRESFHARDPDCQWCQKVSQLAK